MSNYSSMDYYMVVLRVLHIVSGAYWAGAAFVLSAFVTPTAKAAGLEGGKYMQTLARSRLSASLSAAAGITVLSGFLLYWRDSGGFQAAWILSGQGLGYSLGAVAGLAAFAIGALTGRTVKRMGEVAAEMQAAGGPPSPAQMAEIQALQKKLADSGAWLAILLVIALLGMSVARYLFF